MCREGMTPCLAPVFACAGAEPSRIGMKSHHAWPARSPESRTGRVPAGHVRVPGTGFAPAQPSAVGTRAAGLELVERQLPDRGQARDADADES